MIYIYGGTFDPYHYGHDVIINSVLDRKDCEKLVVSLSYNPWYKTKPISNDKLRKQMLELVLKDKQKVEISTLEIDSQMTSSNDFINKFCELNNIEKKSIIFVLGEDSFTSLHIWKNYKEFIKDMKFLVFVRQTLINTLNYGENNNLFYEIIVNTKIINNYSSSKIRENIKNQKPFKELVPLEIFQFINENSLYK